MRTLTLAALLVCPLFGSCAAVALTGSAVILSDDFQDKSVSAIVPSTPNFVWHSTLSSLSGMTHAMVHRDDDLMHARTSVDYGQLQVAVREVAVGQTQIQVLARKAMVYSPELSNIALERIIADFDSLRERAAMNGSSWSNSQDWQDTVPAGMYVGTGGIQLAVPGEQTTEESKPFVGSREVQRDEE
ncbi:MAG: hypothetical protein R3F33_10970 [Planctomycetota bacterium]